MQLSHTSRSTSAVLAQYKLEMLAEYDAADAVGRGVLLRREGLYSSHLSEWPKARDSGALAGLTSTRPCPPTCWRSPGARLPGPST